MCSDFAVHRVRERGVLIFWEWGKGHGYGLVIYKLPVGSLVDYSIPTFVLVFVWWNYATSMSLEAGDPPDDPAQQ